MTMKPPVFIVGCPRSGTSYLYHLLLSLRASFYRHHGFEIAKQNGTGALWSLDLTQHTIASLEWIKVRS
jgi:hypothetical protein